MFPAVNTGMSGAAVYDSRELANARTAWSLVRPVERLIVTVMVDNETDGLSSPCACCDPALDPNTSSPYQSEFTWAVHVSLPPPNKS